MVRADSLGLGVNRRMDIYLAVLYLGELGIFVGHWFCQMQRVAMAYLAGKRSSKGGYGGQLDLSVCLQTGESNPTPRVSLRSQIRS